MPLQVQGEIADLELASGLEAGHPHHRGSARGARWYCSRGPSLFSQLFPSYAFSEDFCIPQSVHERSSAHFWSTCLGDSGAAVQITTSEPHSPEPTPSPAPPIYPSPCQHFGAFVTVLRSKQGIWEGKEQLFCLLGLGASAPHTHTHSPHLTNNYLTKYANSIITVICLAVISV